LRVETDVRMTSYRCYVVLLAVVLTACRAANVLHFESKSDDVICPADGAVCRSQSGEASCCPFKDGQCCNDGAHCCPQSTVCDVTSSACLPTLEAAETVHAVTIKRDEDEQMAAAAVVADIAVKKHSSANQVCPDGGFCFGTCCLVSTDPDTYGCCRFIQADCCPGGKICCAYGYHCDGPSSCSRL